MEYITDRRTGASHGGISLGWAAGVVLAGMLLTAPARSEGPGVAGLKRLLADSGLNYTWNEKGQVAWVKYSDLENTDSKSVGIVVSDEKGYYVKLFLTVLDKEDGHEYPDSLLRKALAMNRTLWVVQFGYDRKNGDIDACVGLDMEGLTGKALKRYCGHLAATADEFAKDLKGAPASPAATGSSTEDRRADVPATGWQQVLSTRWRIEKNYGKWYGIRSSAGVRWKIFIEAAGGSGFDAFVVTPAELENYKHILDAGSGSFKSLERRLKYERCTINWTAPSEGEYFVIVDNTDVPDGGANFGGWFDVDLKIEYMAGE